MVEFNPRFGKQTIVGVPLTNYSQTAKADPTFGENFLAQLGYTYAPLYGAVEEELRFGNLKREKTCLLYTSPSPRDVEESRMPSSA